MIDKWVHLGHRLGECFYCADTNLTYIHIPKNASTFMKTCLKQSGVWIHSEQFITNDRYLVILRDPIERWVSGMAQFEANNTELANPKENLTLTEQWVFDQKTFDDHTELQSYFIQQAKIDQCDFIMMDSNFNSTLNRWFADHGYTIDVYCVPRYNESQVRTKILKNKYQSLIDNNPKYLLKLKEHFADDYKLIESVNFYG